MKVRLNSALQLLALAAAMACASSASAQSAGQWTATVGINKITPKVDAGDVSEPALPGTKVDIGSDTEPVVKIGYGLTNNLSAELDLGLPYKHKLYGAGALQGTGQLATSEVLPPTIFAKYNFLEPNARVRPYVGVGLTYAYFQKETGSAGLTAVVNPGGPPATFKIDAKAAGTALLGTTIAINARWFADLAVTKTWLKTKATYSTGQTEDIRLNPSAVSIGIGYKF